MRNVYIEDVVQLNDDNWYQVIAITFLVGWD